VKQKVIIKILFLLILLYALAMIIPLCIAFFRLETEMSRAFCMTIAIAAATAFPVLLATRKTTISISSKDGILLVFMAWIVASFMGALPYYISRYIPRFTDAVFESVSGFTTTGASIIIDLETMPLSLIFWRAETHWLGGMGMVVLTVALIPFLRVGGFQLLKSEFTGIDKEQITPNITGTAKILWLIYISLTALETVLLVIAGMNLFDAVVHSFSTMATGGFSSHNEGLAYWNSPAIIWIVSIFMIIASINFTLIFRLFQRKWKDVWYSTETRAYFMIILVSTAIIAVSSGNIRTAFFYTASIISTTGFTEGSQAILFPMAHAVLFLLMFIGGCSGSTAGGFKVIRYVVLFKQAGNELKKIIYPSGVFSIQLDNKVGRKDVVYSVAAFIFLYFAFLAVCTIIVASSGLNHMTSFSVALISLGNIGLDSSLLEQVAIFSNLPDYVKWTLSFVMIAGRLELWTAFVFFSKDYWQ